MLGLLLGCADGADSTAKTTLPVVDTAVDTATTTTTTDTAPVTWAPLELCLNEWMPENDASLTGDSGLTPDWIELHNPGSAAVDLAGWTVTDDRDDPRRGPLTGVVGPGGFLVVQADGAEVPFTLAGEGGELGLYAPDGRGSIVTYGSIAADFSVSRVPDCCAESGCFETVFRGTPGVSNVPEVLVETTVLALGGSWAWWDRGTVDAGWAGVGFDDAAWPVGVAPLGYGDAQTTVVGYGKDPYAKYITTWFRARFDVPAGEVRAATVELMRDDAAVVYLDGVEVVRSNLPEGEIDAATLATLSVGAAEETQVYAFAIDPGALPAGPHVLAVEVHQSAADSSDLTFDAGLVLTSPAPP